MALSITSTNLTAGVGKSQLIPLTTTGGTGLVIWELVDWAGLPPGMFLNGRGTLEGTPSGSGSFAFRVRAYDSSAPPQNAITTVTVTVS